MARQDQKEVSWPTPKGEVKILSFCSPQDIEALSFENVQRKYARYHPLISSKESLAKAAVKPDANVTLAHTSESKIVGFAILEYPSSEERWRRVGGRIMMEVSVIEVTAAWRAMGISTRLLELLLDHPLKEDRILYMVGYSWTWDLDGKGVTAVAYRNMLVNLFSRFGFRTFQTNEPNIMLRPENLFMARIGARIPKELEKTFKLVRFDLDRYGAATTTTSAPPG
jgi:acetoin utilization protein AcuA